ncbi:MAG: restriction endonuclease [Firmicutes bacterium]|jgi:restriction system protein|nr:restriction endonuclease [Bacillota bacterium]
MEVDIPQHTELMWSVLESLKALGGSGTISEINNFVIAHGEFTETQLNILHKSGPQTKLEYRLAWARSYLKGIGAVNNSGRGVWSVTKQGEILTPDEVKRLTKERQKIYTQHRHQMINSDATETDEPIDEAWKDHLLRALLNLSPDGFERLAQRLLREAGFVNVNILGRTGDGGIDGVGVYRVSLVSFPVFFQCKRYKGSVGASIVRDFRGAMAGRGEKGLLITTGHFTTEAIAESSRDGAPPVELIDGERLCELLREYELGVKVRQRTEYDIVVDDEFFHSFQVTIRRN